MWSIIGPSPVTMWIYTHAGGLEGNLPWKNNKNGAIWCILSVPKYDIIHLKINNFKDKKSGVKHKMEAFPFFFFFFFFGSPP